MNTNIVQDCHIIANEYRENPVCNCPCISASVQYTSMLHKEVVTERYHINK